MNNETINKFAAIMAAAAAKEAAKVKPLSNATGETPAKAIPAPTPAAIQPAKPTPPAPVFKPHVKDIFPDVATEPAKMKSFTITAHEGIELNIEGKIFTTWKSANDAIKLICDQYTGPGYYKTYILIEWENGRNLSDRIDVQDRKGDFWAYNENIGDYLANHYNSLTSTLSFTDKKTAHPAQLKRFETSKEIESIIHSEVTKRPEISNFTFEDILNEPTPEEEPAHEAQPAPTQATILQPCVMQWTKAGQPTTAPEIATIPAPDQLANYKTMKIGKFTFVEYSEKSFAVIGSEEDTKPIKDKMYHLGGKFNYYLKCGQGYIFATRKFYNVKTFIQSIS